MFFTYAYLRNMNSNPYLIYLLVRFDKLLYFNFRLNKGTPKIYSTIEILSRFQIFFFLIRQNEQYFP